MNHDLIMLCRSFSLGSVELGSGISARMYLSMMSGFSDFVRLMKREEHVGVRES